MEKVTFAYKLRYLDKIVSMTLSTSGVCAGATAFVYMMALRFLAALEANKMRTCSQETWSLLQQASVFPLWQV